LTALVSSRVHVRGPEVGAVDRERDAGRGYLSGAVVPPCMDVVHESDEASTEAVEGVHLKLLAGGTEANVQHFHIEPGAVVPEHSHPNEQLGYVASGTLDFHVDGETRTVEPGDSYVLAGGESHGAENTGDEPAVGVEVFAPPRENPHWRD
jgi:quercetin dioxygenase-like cupin family protein